MLKILSVRVKDPFLLICEFNTNELKVLNALPIIAHQTQLDGVSQLFDKELFSSVEVGDCGELRWKQIVTVANQGESACWDFDISPEYVYEHSKSIKEVVA
jgi:hypothetical protein